MRWNGFKRLPLLLLVLSLGACGFQLRGASTLPPDFSPLYVERGELSDSQLNLVRNALKRASAQLAPQPDQARRLSVAFRESPLRRLTNASPGAIELHRLEMEIEFRLQDVDGEMLIERRSISQSADVELDSSNVLSHSERTREARTALTRGLIRGMVFQMKRR